MQSKAATVEQYLAELPPDRRAAVEAVRAVLRRSLDTVFQEGMGYGMMGYSVPHSVYPGGYHCDPKQPLPFAGLAAQKGGYSLYLMGLYMDPAMVEWFQGAWKKTGKKLDMGKACIRFKRVEDLALDVIAEAVRRMPAKWYIERYEANLASTKQGRAVLAAKDGRVAPAGKPAGRPAAKSVKKVAKGAGSKSAAEKKVAKKAAGRRS